MLTAANIPADGSLPHLATIASERPFTTSRNAPSVISVRGRVRSTRRGRTSAFTMPSNRAAITTLAAPSIRNPPTTASAAHRPRAVMARRTTKPLTRGKITAASGRAARGELRREPRPGAGGEALVEQQGEFAEKIREALFANLPAFNEFLDSTAKSIADALHKAADRAALLIR